MPPSTPTTRGFWGSAFWNNGFFGSDFWKERVPVPTPSPGGGGGGGGGGGFVSGIPCGPALCPTDPDEREAYGYLRCVGLRYRPERAVAFAKEIASKIKKEVGKVSESYADPLGVVRQIPAEKIRKRDLEILRRRIAELEADVRRLEAGSTEAARLAAEAARLRATIAGLEETVLRLEARLEHIPINRRRVYYYKVLEPAGLAEDTEEVQTEEIEVEGSIADRIEADVRRALIAATGRERTRLAPAPSDRVGRALLAAGVAIAAATILPKGILRTVGYGTAVAIAVSDVAKLLGVKYKKEEPKG